MDRYLLWLFVTLLESRICFTGDDVPVTITAAEGEDTVLPCFGVKDLQVISLSWSRSDDNIVLLVSKRGRVMEGYQHPDSTDRVQLQDPQLQRGDLSVILKNVTLKDSGTYQCQALYEHKLLYKLIRLNIAKPNKQDTSIHTNIELTPRRNRELFIGLSLSLSLLLGLVGILTVVALHRYANLNLCKQSHFCSEKPRDRVRCDSVSSSTSTTSSTVSDSSTKALIHPDKKHQPDILRNSWNTLEPLPPFTHPLLPSSSPSSTLPRSSSDPALSGSDPDIDSKPTIPHRSSPDVCALA